MSLFVLRHRTGNFRSLVVKDLFQCTKHELESVRERNTILEQERSELRALRVPEMNMQGRGIVIANGKTYKCEVKRDCFTPKEKYDKRKLYDDPICS